MPNSFAALLTVALFLVIYSANFIEKHLYLGLKVNDNYYTIGKCANSFYSSDAVAIKKVSKECFDREIKYSKKELGNKIKDI